MARADSFGSTVWSDIELARRGDRGALDRFVLSYRDPVVRFLVRRLGVSKSDAEDIAQEVFLEIVRKDLLRKAEPRAGRFRSLLIGITKNIALHHLRGDRTHDAALDRLRRRAEPDEEDAGEFDRLWVVHLLGRAFKRLQKSAQALGNRQDEVVWLSVFEGLSFSQIAEKLGESEGSVRNLMSRGRKKLFDFVREEVQGYAEPGKEYEREVEHVMSLIGHSKG